MPHPCDTDWRLLLTEAERARMLQEIAQVGLAVGRLLFPERTWDDLDIAAGSLLTRKSPVERLGFIVALLPELSRAVEQIARMPLVLPAKEARRVAPPDRARRIDTPSLLRAVRGGHAGRWIEETVTALSPDTPENRAVWAFLQTLGRDARTIAGMAEAAGEAEIAQSAKECAGRLHAFQIGLGWPEMPVGSSWTAPPTHRMLAHPTYARIAEWMRRYRQSFRFDWSHPLFGLPSRETWRIYEIWGLFQTLEALLTLGYQPTDEPGGTSTSLFTVKQDRLLFRLAKGQESRLTLRAPQGRTVSLFYNRPYPARRHSLSRTMQPDITLEDDAGGTWILDPKFKAYATPGDEADDIDQMHAYRDAIVDGNGHKPVRRAWCLYAGRTGGAARPLIAYGPATGSVVGALCLHPGDSEGLTRLCQLLAAWGMS